MKKLIIAVCVLSLLVALCGCGSSKTVSSTETIVQNTQDSVSTTPVVMMSAQAQDETGSEVASQPLVSQSVSMETSSQQSSFAQAAASQELAAPSSAAFSSGAQSSTQTASQAEESHVIEASGYQLELNKISTSTDYYGDKIMVLEFTFTNNNSSTSAYWNTCRDSASQNGQSLNSEECIVDYSLLVGETQQVGSGQSVNVCVAYPMIDESAPVDVTFSIVNPNTGLQLASGSATMYITD